MQAQNRDDIQFDRDLTQAEFETFSRLVAQGIYATPVEPAHAAGLLGFDIGIAATGIQVDPNASYWAHSTSDNDFTVSDYVAVPRLVVSKGLSFATIAASYAKVPDTDLTVLGGSIDYPITRGGIATPTLALRGAYSTLRGSDDFDLSTYGLELFLSKGFGPITPYAAAGYARSNAEGRVFIAPGPTLLPVEPTILTDKHSGNRFTVGVKISLLIPKLVIEATQGEERSYAAKVSFGF
jgi:hypothetical protein